jgi:uncharacterized RDD family membrane protein YckC
MTQVPAGWYPDPAPAPPGAPPAQRYWDGAAWTEHVHTPGAAPYGPLSPVQPTQPVGAQAYATHVATTPDGERLAGWWARVGAYVIDSLVLGIVSGIIGFPFVSRVWNRYVDFFDATVRASRNGTAPPSQLDLLSSVYGSLAAVLAISMVASLVYNVGFLKTMQATPGKLALGLRVRLRERPGPLSWGTVLRRWLAQNVGSLVALIPLVGSLGSIYRLLDDLWPLWDGHKQALHDKFAATNVVVSRRR